MNETTHTLEKPRCRCGHLENEHGSRYEQRDGEKCYVQPCRHCACEHVTRKGGPLDQLIESVSVSQAASGFHPPCYLSTDYQRIWDLVRAQRGELLDAGLITRREYAALLADETADKPGTGSPSPRRLESYDELRAENQRLREVLTDIEGNCDCAGDCANCVRVCMALAEYREIK